VSQHLILTNAQGERHRYVDTPAFMAWLSDQRGWVSAFPLQVLDGAAAGALPPDAPSTAAVPSTPAS